VIVIIAVQLAPAASSILLQLSTEVAIIEGCDKLIAPVVTDVALGLVKCTSTVVDCPTSTVGAVTSEVVNRIIVVPVRLTRTGASPPTTGTVSVAVCEPYVIGAYFIVIWQLPLRAMA